MTALIQRPIVITMGDPAGIGPEIIRALLNVRASDPILIIGDARMLNLPVIRDPRDFKGGHFIWDIPCPFQPVSGQPDEKNARTIQTWIELATDLVKSGNVAALVTAPISKEILIKGANFAYPGHTEFLAHLDGAKQPVMMLASSELTVVPATIHIPLSEVPKAFTPDLLREVIEITHRDLTRLNGHAPKIVVAGLNPHAGEGGKIGHEEQDWMEDLVAELAQKMDISGPFPADTMFHKKARQHYDVAICAYHDQALIPIKTLAFDEGVNVTLGLSFLRTSPDHGTAFDIAGKGLASPSSMIAAYDFAKRHL